MKRKIKITFTLVALFLVQFSFAQWTQMANYPCGPIFTQGFSIGNKACLMLGRIDTTFYNSVYEYVSSHCTTTLKKKHKTKH